MNPPAWRIPSAVALAVITTGCGPDPLVGEWDCTALQLGGDNLDCPRVYAEDDYVVNTYGYGLDITSITSIDFVQLRTYSTTSEPPSTGYEAEHYEGIGTLLSRGSWQIDVGDLDLSMRCTAASEQVACEGAWDGQVLFLFLGPAKIPRP